MVSYLISWGDPLQRLYDVEIRFIAPRDEPRLFLPVWRPGRYLVQNYAANVRQFSAVDSAGERLDTWKEDLSTWCVAATGGEEVVVRYRFYAGRLDAGSSFLDEHEAYFNGSNLFMMVDALRSEPVELTVAAPAEWTFATQLPREGTTLRARDYDHLIDSPVIVAETLTRYTFNASGARIHLVFSNDDGVDTEQYVEPVRQIVESQARLIGELPFQEYHFLTHIGDRWHGVEHEDSCSIIAERKAMLSAHPGTEGYDHFLSIVAHELFHAWNVKRLLPLRFAPYDYFRPTPTKLLWFFEGGTSYFGDLSLTRSGVWSVDRYLDHIAAEIATLENAPGREILSATEASFDGWLHDPAHLHDRTNAWFSFYNKGELLSLMLDLTIREKTGGTRSLDDVFRVLWHAYEQGSPGVTEDGIEKAVAEVADVGDFFARYVDGTEDLPYADMLATAGIEMHASTMGEGRPAIGCTLRDQGGALTVDAVYARGAGGAAGLLAGDEIISLDGVRVRSAADVQRILGTADDDESLEAVISRNGVMRMISIRAISDPRVEVRLTHEGTSERMEQWLGRKA
jgi:predicted metalloprotease with PDZ domain